MSLAVLKITDGTSVNTIDLLSRRSGYLLCNWQPAKSEFVYVMDKNWFSGVETPLSMTQNPANEVMTFNARHDNTNSLIAEEQKMNRILRSASLYWTGNRSVSRPYYIVAKNRYESGLRYASLFSAQLHSSNNPYASPFFAQFPSETDLVVPLTRGPWLDYIPGQDGLAMLSNVSSTMYSSFARKNKGVYFLSDDSRIPISNFSSHMGITHIFVDGSTTNLLESAEGGTYTIMGTGTTNFTYFGVQMPTAVSDATLIGIHALHFNIVTPLEFGATEFSKFIWYAYKDTIGWDVIQNDDRTDVLRQSGSIFFQWDQSANQKYVQTTVNGITGFWVRTRPGYALTTAPQIGSKFPDEPSNAHIDVYLSNDESKETPGEFDLQPGEPPDYDLATANILLLESSESTSGVVPFDLYFSAKGNAYLTSYEWTVLTPGRNYIRLTPNFITTKFYSEGEYVLFFTAPTEDGNIKRVRAEGYWKVTASKWKAFVHFTVDDINPSVGDTVTFTDDSTWDIVGDTVDYSIWHYGDYTYTLTSSSIPTNPTHVYNDPGTYTVTLEVYWTSGRRVATTKSDMIIVHSDVVAACTVANRRGYAPFNPGFDASDSSTTATSITTYEWWFGDGTTGSGVQPNKTYTAPGIYTVRLKVTDNLAETNEIVLYDYIYVDNAQLNPGDDGVFLRFSLRPMLIEHVYPVSPLGYPPNKIYIGARSIHTGDDFKFQSFFPPYRIGVNVPHGVWYSVVTGSSFEWNHKSPTGYVYSMPTSQPTLGEEELFVTLYFGANVYERYRGSYRVFLRMSSSGDIAKGDIYFSAGTSTTSGSDDFLISLNKTKRLSDVLNPDYVTVFDLGSVVLGGSDVVTRDLDIYWQVFDDAGYDVVLYDIVLIPQDEWFTELSFTDFKFYSENNYELQFGSLTPNGELYARIWNPSSGLIVTIPSSVPGKPLTTIGNDMRFCIFSTTYDSREPKFTAYTPIQYSSFHSWMELTEASKVNKYFGSRGNR